MTYDMEHVFICLFFTCVSSLMRSVLRFLAYFLIGFSYGWVFSSLYIWMLLSSCSVVSNSLWAHGLQHARPPCPSPAPELAQTHVCRISDAIQPFHPLLHPSLPALTLSQHQGLLQWVSSSHQVAKVMDLQLQHHSFQWIFTVDFL